FQQIQKYEKSFNRVSAGRLQEIANILEVPITFFYADIATQEDNLTKENHSHHDQKTYSEKEYTLLKNFRELHPKKQKAIWWLISD
ncbi:transcriptional regulator, partial [Bartonella gabonensis]|uniref:transcriptional regulator n=1 Tax=Bartonella gabonensis TaxID=2699889 RepID=UPI00158C0A16